MPDIVSLRPTDWIKGVECYAVTDSTFKHMPAGTRYTINDLNVIGSLTQGVVAMRIQTGNKLGRGPQWSPFTPSVPKRSESMETTTETTTAVADAPEKATRKKAVRRTAKSSGSATKRSPKKKAAKKAAKGAKKGGAKKATRAPSEQNGLGKPQNRILAALMKGGELTRAQIAEKAKVDVAFCTSWIGSNNPETRAKNDQKVGVSLISQGLVSFNIYEGSRATYYTLTAKGKKVAAKL